MRFLAITEVLQAAHCEEWGHEWELDVCRQCGVEK